MFKLLTIGEAICVGEGSNIRTLYYLLNFSINLELLLKKKLMKRKDYIISALMPNFVLDFIILCLFLVLGRQKLIT